MAFHCAVYLLNIATNALLWDFAHHTTDKAVKSPSYVVGPLDMIGFSQQLVACLRIVAGTLPIQNPPHMRLNGIP